MDTKSEGVEYLANPMLCDDRFNRFYVFFRMHEFLTCRSKDRTVRHDGDE